MNLHDRGTTALAAAPSCGLGALLHGCSTAWVGICGPNPTPDRKLTTAVQVIDPGCTAWTRLMRCRWRHGQPPDAAIRGGEPPMWLPEQLLW